MQRVAPAYERVTISLPTDISKDIDKLKKELNVSKSELFKKAFMKFAREHKKQKLRKTAAMMAEEYKTNKELTVFTALDSEDFK
ncbi:MAG: ribbon-helix-helix protein, CopG family [Nitrospirae bacterium]|nr:ribbon-helix-helix protein, CopG family [Nitrospirota bacterium]